MNRHPRSSPSRRRSFGALAVVLGTVALVAGTAPTAFAALAPVGGPTGSGWVGVYEAPPFAEPDAHDAGWNGVVELPPLVEL